jgi:CRP-like cAMP-binding protein
MAIDRQATGQPVEMDAQHTARLRHHPLLAWLQKDDLTTFLSYLDVRSFPAEAVIGTQGEPADGLYFILEGHGDLHRHQMLLGHLGPGDHFGELGASASHPVTVMAVTPLTLVALARERFEAMVQAHPALAMVFLRVLVSQIEGQYANLQENINMLLKNRSLPRRPEVQEGRSDDAYALLGRDLRARYSREEFARLLGDSSAEARAALVALGAAAADVDVRAEVPLPDGTTLRLVQVDRRWYLADDPLAYGGQATPREALRSFVRAGRARRYDLLVELVPDRWRRALTPDQLRADWEGPRQDEIARLLADLHAAVLRDAPIAEKGDEATMAYGERQRVRFVREGGKWRIEDPD